MVHPGEFQLQVVQKVERLGCSSLFVLVVEGGDESLQLLRRLYGGFGLLLGVGCCLLVGWLSLSWRMMLMMLMIMV